MAIDRTRGWARRGLMHPSPWGDSIPDGWADAEFHFYSRVSTPTKNRVGGFSGSLTAAEELVIRGVAQIVTESAAASDPGETPTQRRYYDLFVDLPLPDGATKPSRGDRVWFLDALGDTIDLAIRFVDIPEGGANHLEIQTEDYV